MTSNGKPCHNLVIILATYLRP